LRKLEEKARIEGILKNETITEGIRLKMMFTLKMQF
jgi:hypothetical protein